MSVKLLLPLLFLLNSSTIIGQVLEDFEERVNRVDAAFDPATVLWFDQPAAIWEEALPVGNGRIGAMVYGKSGEEIIQFNEDTYWSGGPYSTVVKGGHEKLPEIQKYIFNGEPLKAHKLFGRALMGYPVEQQKYQSLANLHLNFNEEEVNNYKRALDLKTGVVTVTYQSGGVNFTRSVFASAVDQTIVVRIAADQPNSISLDAELRGVRNQAHSNYATDYFRMDGEGKDQLIVTGKSADYLGVEGKLRYEARIRAVPEGGSMERDDALLSIADADRVTLYFVAATNFKNYKDVSADQHARIMQMMDQVEGRSYEQIKAAAIKDHRKYFDRVSLSLPVTENAYLPTDQRMEEIQRSPDPQLATLCYNFGRYLLIASSRPGTQPANLQGIWNNDMNPAWDSKYTTNINTQMNYWAVETANLPELLTPFTKMVKELTDQGSEVAREHYGAGGWVMHQNTDLWRVAAPMDGPAWGTFTTGGAWLTTHLWEHYLFAQDLDYLKEVYPILKGSVTFFKDFLVAYPNSDWLVTNPSNSPENPPKGEGYRYFFDEVTGFYYFTTIAAGSTIDMQILKDLFSYYISATEVLEVDKEFAGEIQEIRNRLVPSLIGKDGTLQEWTEDFEQLEEKHRHYSHLYGLYPGKVISVENTPELIDPVKKVLEQRGDGATGWSRAWKMNLWARLYDGNRANKIFKGYLKEQCYPSLFGKCGKPLQVDGSFGVTAGITEMLLQSHQGYLHFLPALPSDWSAGSFKGVCARGGFELDYSWENSNLVSVEVLSKTGNACVIKSNKRLKVTSEGKKVSSSLPRNGTVTFATSKGKRYAIEGL
jgi:alpha-L-fucosidase 2